MLKKLILENWKSFRYAELYFDPLTVLIGTNASGKSNVVEALEFLRRMATGETVDVALNGDRVLPPIRGGSEWITFRPNDETEFTLKILLQEEKSETDILRSIKINPQLKYQAITDESIGFKSRSGNFEKSAKDGEIKNYFNVIDLNYYLNFFDFESFKNLFNNNPIIRKTIKSIVLEELFKDEKYKAKYDEDIRYDEKVESFISISHEEVIKDSYLQVVMSFVKKTLTEILILNPIPSQMRDFSRLSETIEQDMSNIAGVLAALPEDQKLEVESTLSYYLQHFPEGYIKKIWAEKIGRLGTDAMLYCQEEWQPGQITEIDARSMSDGTLRFIGILTALLIRPEGSLIVIEEIDNGLHPSRAELLVRTLREIGTKRKIDLLITTHNPALLDALGPEIVPFVVVAHRDSETGESKLTQLEDIENLPKLLASGTLGKLATKGSIEKSLAESV